MAARTKRTNFRRYNRVANVARFTGLAFKRARAFTRTSTRTRTLAAPAPITGESDWRNVYKRKRMPARRRRRWVKFSRSVKHVLANQIGSNFNVRVNQTSLPGTNNGQGVNFSHTILGMNGSDPSHNDGIYLVNLAVANQPSTGPGVPTLPSAQNMKIVVTGWMCETMITNLETYPVFVDMYYWLAKRDIPSTFPDIGSVWSDRMADLRVNQTLGAGVTTLTLNDYGVTPFQGVEFAKKIQVWKKTRVKLAGGSVTQVETRGSRDTVITWSHQEHNTFARGVTQGIMFVAYGSPDGVDLVARAADLQIVTNKNYTWRMINDSRIQGAHLQA